MYSLQCTPCKHYYHFTHRLWSCLQELCEQLQFFPQRIWKHAKGPVDLSPRHAQSSREKTDVIVRGKDLAVSPTADGSWRSANVPPKLRITADVGTLHGSPQPSLEHLYLPPGIVALSGCCAQILTSLAKEVCMEVLFFVAGVFAGVVLFAVLTISREA